MITSLDLFRGLCAEVQYTYLPVSICSHTQELTSSKFLNMSIISLNLTNLPFLSWSRSSAHYQVVNVYPLVAIE